MIWITTSVEKFHSQREMRIRLLIRRTWLRTRESLQSLLRITSSHVSFLNTPKEVFDALTKLFERKNIYQEMAFRNKLKNVKIQNAETMQSYFTRVAQIKEQPEALKL